MFRDGPIDMGYQLGDLPALGEKHGLRVFDFLELDRQSHHLADFFDVDGINH